jgi:demethylmenaquinone methyltransferase/2-methoxy-6-polyprenyl-1,4-benzoquinol methylase
VSSVLPRADEKPRFVANMFGRIAARYDLMNTLMTAGQDRSWRRLTAALALGPDSTARSVLDVGTGTGKLAEAIQALAPAADVIGVDFALPMLRAGSRRVALAQADGMRLPFADETFDAVTSGFVVRNLGDVRVGLVEQVRVLRPGGRLVILETTPGPGGWIRIFFEFYFRRLVPLLGTLVAGDATAYTYLPESTLAFVEPSRLREVLRAAGLRDVQTRALALGCVALTCGRKPSVIFD